MAAEQGPAYLHGFVVGQAADEHGVAYIVGYVGFRLLCCLTVVGILTWSGIAVVRRLSGNRRSPSPYPPGPYSSQPPQYPVPPGQFPPPGPYPSQPPQPQYPPPVPPFPSQPAQPQSPPPVPPFPSQAAQSQSPVPPYPEAPPPDAKDAD